MPRLLDVLVEAQPLFPAAAVPLRAILRHTNEAEFDAEWARHLITEAYAARVAQVERVALGRLPEGTILGGRHHFVLQVRGEAVRDTLPHVLRDDPQALAAALAADAPPEDLAEECVVLARYGHGTWGHWLAEIVPMAVAVEQRAPGRFNFLIPGHGGRYGAQMRASLAAYGIGAERLIETGWSNPLRLWRAWCVSPIWSDHIPHPAAIHLMRAALPSPSEEAAPAAIALIRPGETTRRIANEQEVLPMLEGAGFRPVDVAALPFLSQVALFRGARRVFGVVGSGLTGLIYAPDGVAVLATGPARWGDRFFYALGQLRAARWVEVRGPSSWDGQGEMRDAAFTIPPAALATGLARL